MKLRRYILIASVIFSSITIPPTANAGLFTFSTHTFTPCGVTGPSGPTTANCTGAYTSATWANNTSYFNTSSGKQLFTIPTAGSYRITVAGAAGGTGPNYSGGNGAILVSEFTFAQGDGLTLLVGQQGLTGRVSAGTGGAGGGGGGSFVYKSNSTTLLLAAGGGGGGAKNSAGVDASTSVNAAAGRYGSTGGTLNAAGTTVNTYNSYYGGSGGGATAGNGAQGSGGGGLGGGGGAGYTGNGGIGNNNSITAYSYVNGGTGSYHSYSGYGSQTQAAGGFGGGGNGTYMDYYAGGGGGGGYTGGGGGNGWGSNSYAGGGGGGGGSYISGSNQSSSVTNTGNGYITITLIAPAVTSFAPGSTLTNSSSITYDLVFSEAVTGLASSDFSLSGTGSSSCTVNAPTGSNATYIVTVTGCSPGDVLLSLNSDTVLNGSSLTGPVSATPTQNVIIDQTVPTISSVTAPTNKTYLPAETPTFTVNFSESVTVTGTPRLTLTVGTSTKYANYVSMSDSKTALFRYTVGTATDEFDTDGIAISTTLDLNSGTIRDLATNALTLTFTAPTLTSVLVAQPAAAPTIESTTATSGTINIYFTPGAARGSTTSTYQYSSNGGAWTTRASGSTASPLTISSLTDGTGYTIRIRAVTNAGNSDSSTAITETPTAVTVVGQSTLTLIYGNSASTSAYSATGGNNSYTWSLGSSISGVTLSGTTVTASSTLGAGTYIQTVRALDTSTQVGVKTLTITVNKASTSISIALPNSATTAAASGTVTITATVPRAGSVSFKEGSTVVCTSAAASTTATCAWTAPGTLGSVNLTAIFTPTDSSNYETSTSTTLTISVVNGVSTVSLSLAGGVTSVPKGQAIVITAAIDQAGKVTFYVDGKKIPKCINMSASVGNKTCSWKPAVQKPVVIKATLNPTNNVYQNSSSTLNVWVIKRTGTRS